VVLKNAFTGRPKKVKWQKLRFPDYMTTAQDGGKVSLASLSATTI